MEKFLTRQELSNYLESLLVSESHKDFLYAPEIDDLYFLYSLVREKSIVSILEFGSGWSTAVLSLALQENFLSFGDQYLAQVRHPNPFKMVSIDASKDFQKIAVGRIPAEQIDNLLPIHSVPKLSDDLGVLSHRYDLLPNFTPDLVYLDGPDHDQVVGEVNGFHYKDSFTPPISSDLLFLEPYIWPESYIVVDGRTANARFLNSRLRRNWEMLHDPFGDRTIFRLAETPFGSVSESHINIRLEMTRKLVNKEIPQGTK